MFHSTKLIALLGVWLMKWVFLISSQTPWLFNSVNNKQYIDDSYIIVIVSAGFFAVLHTLDELRKLKSN